MNGKEVKGAVEVWVQDFLNTLAQELGFLPWVSSILGLAILFVVAWIAFGVTRRYLLSLLAAWIRKSEITWDDALLEKNVLSRAALFAPVVIVYFGFRLIPGFPPPLEMFGERMALAALVLSAVVTISKLLDAINHVYAKSPVAKGRPIKGYIQIGKMFAYLMAIVLVVAVVLDKSPMVFLTGIGAMTAVLLLIFRDTILSFVASIQIVSNDMVRIGDWIEMPKYGADGDVIDIALHTIKVQNFDKTITTIPTYRLIDDSFKNWRGMQESGGRRIKRSVNVDMGTIRFLDEADIERFAKFALLRDYISAKKQDLDSHNEKVVTNPPTIANARRLTNVGTFRAYVAAYLRQHPMIYTKEMTFLVRQLQPGAEGLPIEIYVFTTTTDWVEYEGIQADIFDHILTIIREFDLRVFQNPTGSDFVTLAGSSSTG